ncbi:MFS transporter [Sphingomonas sp. QA11]|uniref:MFS transporter n=1 Tax=Sphingomonas sp. QA11 TaxID=2950605 RepID=UPI00234BFFC6|nr:MFS transporter [Sphingomonas sp. QA11]WCM25999.1 MFS transporter [Sphingomonas sp. QA11]
MPASEACAPFEHPRPGISKLSPALIFLFALASGLAVANAYFAHPMLDVMADAVGLPRAQSGLIVGMTQLGYGLGLIFLVPLGDLFDRRRLVIFQSSLSVAALLAIGLSPTAATLLTAMAFMGFLAVTTQSFVAYAASLAEDAERGHVVGLVTGGIVIGLLGARTLSGVVTDLAGWRVVYLTSAVLTSGLVMLLAFALPAQPKTEPGSSYRALIASLFTLFRAEPVLRVRSLLAMLIFANITTLLTPLVLPLSAPPFSLSHTGVDLFGLAGIAGALGATRAGRWTDRGLGQRVTGIALTMMLTAWTFIAMLPHGLGWLVIGVVMIDFGLQAVHVTNQAMIYRVRPEAQSRLTAAYMVFYSIGSALGSSASTLLYTHAGWSGVCALGAAISVLSLIPWMSTRDR